MRTLTASRPVSDESEKILASCNKKYARVLQPSDSDDFRSIRLEALQRYGWFFAASYEEEKSFTNNQWRRICTEEKDRCMIGIFDEDELVGVTAALRWEEDPTGQTVLFRSSYLRPEYRGKGLSSLLCESRITWAKRNPQFNVALLFHREGHWISKVVLSLGAQYWQSRPMQWANGQIANGLWYRLKLRG